MEILKGVLDEEGSYLSSQEKEIIGRLLILPRGSIKKRTIGGKPYYYLQYRKSRRVIHKYLGKHEPGELSKSLQERKKLESELKKVREALHMLRKSNSDTMLGPIMDVFEGFAKIGLWEEGIELIGSWCFKIYQEHLEVEKFPFRTQDIDLLIPLPYRGKVIPVPALLKQMGFNEGFNPDGSIYFHRPGLRIDFLVPEKGRGVEKSVKVDRLSLPALALRFVDLLFIEPMEIQVARGIKVQVPSRAAFFIHKLIVSQRRNKPGDRLKDLEQAAAVGRSLLIDREEKARFIRIWAGIPARWRTRTRKGLELARKELSLKEDLLEKLAEILSNP